MAQRRSLLKRKLRSRNPEGLSGRIEAEVVPAAIGSSPGQLIDSKDADLLGYVNSFLADFSRLPKMEKFSLLTPDDAAEALKIIDKTKADLDRRLRNAQLLRGLLEQKKED